MKIQPLASLSHIKRSPHGAVFSCSKHSQTLSVSVLDHDLFRIQVNFGKKREMDRTFLVTGKDGDFPFEGRSRDDLSAFSNRTCNITESKGQITISTMSVDLEFSPADVAFQWFSADNFDREPFARDVPGRAYCHDSKGTSVWHYMMRDNNKTSNNSFDPRDGNVGAPTKEEGEELYFGFGEVSGRLNKKGKRIEMRNLDALGYDAKNGGPLYKHFPFYITLCTKTNIAYGIFYDNLSSSIFDMGHEIDAYHGAYRYYKADYGDLDYYFIYGPTVAAVVQKISFLTGRPAFPPRWSLGYLASGG